MGNDEADFIRWVAQHANQRGHNRYTQDEKAAFLAGFAAGQVAALTEAAEWYDKRYAEGTFGAEVARSIRARAVAAKDEHSLRIKQMADDPDYFTKAQERHKDDIRRERGIAHDHREYVAGCPRCDLSRDEVPDAAERVMHELRQFLPEWGYPPHVVAAICLEIKARIGEV